MEVHHVRLHTVQPFSCISKGVRCHAHSVSERNRHRRGPSNPKIPVGFQMPRFMRTGRKERHLMAEREKALTETPDDGCGPSDPRIVEIGYQPDLH
ncbi:MAG: hypothetical protein DLM70_09265 [Chloroflexi bacterium]|nr:MAG: hypothetical protein DLM70_09265 [Chloroflexota bacterium]